MPRLGQSNNMQEDLPECAKARRDPIEDALAALWRMLVDIDELEVRMAQAIYRSATVHPVLSPAQERLAQMRTRLANMHTDLSAYWSAGQAHRWE